VPGSSEASWVGVDGKVGETTGSGAAGVGVAGSAVGLGARVGTGDGSRVGIGEGAAVGRTAGMSARAQERTVEIRANSTSGTGPPKRGNREALIETPG
jgi:hypothetical protein